MEGFKDSTKMKYMTGGPVTTAAKPERTAPPTGVGARGLERAAAASGRTFDKNGPTKDVGSRERTMPIRDKKDTVSTYKKRGNVAEGVSSRPTDSSGRRATNADLGIERASEPKIVGKGIGAASAAVAMGNKAAALARKGVPAHSDRPMIRRKAGGLAVMPKGKCK